MLLLLSIVASHSCTFEILFGDVQHPFFSLAAFSLQFANSSFRIPFLITNRRTTNYKFIINHEFQSWKLETIHHLRIKELQTTNNKLFKQSKNIKPQCIHHHSQQQKHSRHLCILNKFIAGLSSCYHFNQHKKRMTTIECWYW